MGLFDALGSLFGGEDAALREEFREEAAALVDAWDDRDLDYTPASLAAVDEAVAERFDTERFADATFGGDGEVSTAFTGATVQVGSYLGEVVVRSLDAEWVDDDEFGAAVRAYGDDEDAVVNVFHVAAERLRGEGSLADTFDQVAVDVGSTEWSG